MTGGPAADRVRSTSAPAVSVVVPTRDRPSALVRCLGALARQERVTIEVLVVDDGTVDRAGLAGAVAAHSQVHVIDGGGQGPAAARNLGARRARYGFVAFTDDDCEPTRGWASALAQRLAEGATVVAGATVNARPRDPYSAASQAITNYLTRDGQQGFAASNNLACRRELARAFPFDESYPEAAGEDRDWCLRVQAAGHRVETEEAAVVRHRQDLGWSGFVRQQLRYGRGARALVRLHGSAATRSRPAFYLGLVREGFRHGPRVGALVLLAQALVLAGFLQHACSSRGSRARLQPVRRPQTSKAARRSTSKIRW